MKKWLSPEAERYLGLGLQLAGAVLLGFFAGYYVDRRWGTLPFGTLGGCFLGFVAGGIGFFYQLKGLESDDDE